MGEYGSVVKRYTTITGLKRSSSVRYFQVSSSIETEAEEMFCTPKTVAHGFDTVVNKASWLIQCAK